MKKIIIIFLLGILSVFLAQIAYAATNDMNENNITINFPLTNTYNASTGDVSFGRLNATVKWNNNTGNITNVSFVFISGTTRHVFFNDTMNGTATPATTGLSQGDFTVGWNVGNLTADKRYTLRVEVRNSTTSAENDAVNSSAINFTLDSTKPAVALSSPSVAENIIPVDNLVYFYYTPSDTNLANVTLYLSGSANSKATSNTMSGNATSGSVNYLSARLTTSGEKTWIVEAKDLAGNSANSSSRTVNIITASEGGEPIVGATGGTLSGGIESVLSVSTEEVQGFLQQNLWIILAIIVIIVIVAAKKRKKR